jgi:hypothetical protein
LVSCSLTSAAGRCLSRYAFSGRSAAGSAAISRDAQTARPQTISSSPARRVINRKGVSLVIVAVYVSHGNSRPQCAARAQSPRNTDNRNSLPNSPVIRLQMARCCHRMGRPGEAGISDFWTLPYDLEPRRSGSNSPSISRPRPRGTLACRPPTPTIELALTHQPQTPPPNP